MISTTSVVDVNNSDCYQNAALVHFTLALNYWESHKDEDDGDDDVKDDEDNDGDGKDNDNDDDNIMIMMIAMAVTLMMTTTLKASCPGVARKPTPPPCSTSPYLTLPLLNSS